MNNVNLIGNITNEITLETTNTGLSTVTFTLADNRKNNSGVDVTNFIFCKSFGKTAEVIAKYFSKGQKIGVTGSLNTYNFEKNGQTLFGYNVLVSSFTFIGKKESKEVLEPEIEVEDDDLPF